MLGRRVRPLWGNVSLRLISHEREGAIARNNRVDSRPAISVACQSATSFAMTALALHVAARACRRKPAGSSSSESDEASLSESVPPVPYFASALRRRVLASSRAPEQDPLANFLLTPTSDAKAATTFLRHGMTLAPGSELAYRRRSSHRR